ncbi:alpha/beta hydrolase [Tsukamurella sp. NPDC003166]|uniref:alpha/beta hydrolase n=1 Tax=Tsukamurella sp. NPDC003166 TaxID=3154444 RepID=UPI0033A67F16
MPLPLDPEFAAEAGALLDAIAAGSPPARGDWVTRRDLVPRLLRRLGRALPENPSVRRTSVAFPSTAGHECRAVWYTPDTVTGAGAALFIHGGGMILGSVDLFDRMVAKYVADSGVPMLSVDYRLAPEHPYPAAVDDCFAALTWLHANAERLGIDPCRIAVMGESAGGGLAAATALRSRDRGGPPIAAQLLIYPMLDDRTRTVDEQIASSAFWTYDDNATGWDAYLGALAGDDVPAEAAPGRSTDLGGLPPAYIEIGELDIFRDEAVRYSDGLWRSGVPAELVVTPGIPHSFEWIAPGTGAAQRSFANRARRLRSI